MRFWAEDVCGARCHCCAARLRRLLYLRLPLDKSEYVWCHFVTLKLRGGELNNQFLLHFDMGPAKSIMICPITTLVGAYLGAANEPTCTTQASVAMFLYFFVNQLKARRQRTTMIRTMVSRLSRVKFHTSARPDQAGPITWRWLFSIASLRHWIHIGARHRHHVWCNVLSFHTVALYHFFLPTFSVLISFLLVASHSTSTELTPFGVFISSDFCSWSLGHTQLHIASQSRTPRFVFSSLCSSICLSSVQVKSPTCVSLLHLSSLEHVLRQTSSVFKNCLFFYPLSLMKKIKFVANLTGSLSPRGGKFTWRDVRTALPRLYKCGVLQPVFARVVGCALLRTSEWSHCV